MVGECAEVVTREVLDRLDGVRRESAGQWAARCPAHEDRKPSLSISDGLDGRILLHCHAGCETETVLAALGMVPGDLFADAPSSNGTGFQIEVEYDYVDEDGTLLFQVVRLRPKSFRQRRPDGMGGWIWKLGDTRRVLYRLPEIVESVALERTIYVVEGEKDADRLVGLGLCATTNPGGVGKWRTEYSTVLRGAHVAILPDNDKPGWAHAEAVAESLRSVAEHVRVVELPGLPEKSDVSDWLRAGGTVEELDRLVEASTETPPTRKHRDEYDRADGVTLADFYAYMREHKYIFTPTGDLWPAASVNALIPLVSDGGEELKASSWLDRHQHVEQMTWAPGEPTLIQDRLILQGGWIDRPGVRVFNLYRPPMIERGDPTKAVLWVEHVRRVFPGEADHIIRWLAHRVQRPEDKINHALVLQGAQGTGKDTIIEGAIPAVGEWNCQEVSPSMLLGRFNGYLKAVILRVSEARDLGDADRYRLYDHLKTYTAAPPAVLRVDEKNIREYAIPNFCGVVITTNYVDGVFLPADDRRHYVAWTELTKEDFTEQYWHDIYTWYDKGDGCRHVAAYLAEFDLSQFNPKAPPPKTTAFWNVVDAGRSPEDAELADVLDKLMNPRAVTLRELAKRAESEFGEWLRDRKNSRKIPHRLGAAGYVRVRNDTAQSGLWVVGGKRQVVYARRELPVRDRIAAVSDLVERWGQ